MTWPRGRVRVGALPIGCLIAIIAHVESACAIYDISSLGGAVIPGPDDSGGVRATEDALMDAAIARENVSETTIDVGPSMIARLDVEALDASSADSPADAPTDPDSPVIDDMEDGNASILSHGGRAGAWIAANDGTVGGVQTPAPGQTFTMSEIPGGRNGSTRAVHATSNSAFAIWGSQIGFDLNLHFGTEGTYDASRFTGFTFWARSSSDAVTLRFEAADIQNAPQGEICTDDGGTSKCFDHFGEVVEVTSAWRQFTIAFSAMTQQGFGMRFAAIRSDKLFGCTFLFPPGAASDVWIDDISFY